MHIIFLPASTQKVDTKRRIYPMPRKEDATAFYAVRGGLGHGVYTKWSEAVNAGWYSKQGFGNAVKCDTREEADDFLKVRPFAQGKAGQVQSWVSRQHFLVQLTIFMLVSTLGGVAGFHALVYAENIIRCREDINLSMSPVCVALAEIRIVFTKNTIYLVQFIAVEIVIGIGVIASYLANFITSPAPRVA